MATSLSSILKGVTRVLWRQVPWSAYRIEHEVEPSSGDVVLRVRFKEGEVVDDVPKPGNGPVSAGASAGWKEPERK